MLQKVTQTHTEHFFALATFKRVTFDRNVQVRSWYIYKRCQTNQKHIYLHALSELYMWIQTMVESSLTDRQTYIQINIYEYMCGGVEARVRSAGSETAKPKWDR